MAGPYACPTNATAWTDPTLTANVTYVRAVHVTQLRTAINNERGSTRRNIGSYSFTDPTITANSTYKRNIHVSQLRTAIEQAQAAWCPSNSVPAPVWTDPTLTANITYIRKVHFDEMRSVTNNLETTCICNCNHCGCDCNFCACNCNCTCCTCHCNHWHRW